MAEKGAHPVLALLLLLLVTNTEREAGDVKHNCPFVLQRVCSGDE
jgi:hypothetical protein